MKVGYYKLKDGCKEQWLSNKMNVHIYKNCNRSKGTFIINKIINNEGYSGKFKVISERERWMFKPLSKLEIWSINKNDPYDGLELFKDGTTRYIVCAANRYKNGLIIPGSRHFDLIMCNILDGMKTSGIKFEESCEQGFIDQFGEFHSRKHAMAIVACNGQKFDLDRNGGSDDKLYSEGLY